MTLPLPHPWVPDVLVQQNLEAIAESIDRPVPQARVYNSANISVADATDTALTFNSERYDDGSLHSTASNTSRLTVAVPGVYAIGGNAEFASNATGLRQAGIRVNGATTIAAVRLPALSGASTMLNVTCQYRFAAADYVELVVLQTSGAALLVLAGANFSPEFWIVRLAGYAGEQYTV